MKRVDFQQLTFWVDYDRPKLPLLTRAQRLEYFRRRANKVVLRPLRQILRLVRQATTRSSAVLCFGTCICSAIEAFGRFHTGKVGMGTGADSFRAFVTDFMDPDFAKQLHGKSYAKLLHDHFRNGLAHGFTIKWGGFEFSPALFLVRLVGPTTVLEIDPCRLYEDFARGVSDYVTKLKSAPNASPRYVKFSAVFDELWVKGT